MDYPGHNSYWALADEVVKYLTEASPLTLDELLARFGGVGGRNVSLSHRTVVPLGPEHIRKVLMEHLAGYVDEVAAGWRLRGRRPPLAPIWKMYPYPWGSMGYRMGSGEDYWHRWVDWYCRLDVEAQKTYREQNPEPEAWRHFYEMMAHLRDHDGLMAVLDKKDRAQLEYVAAEYARAKSCDSRGDTDEAFYHYGQVLTFGGEETFPDARDRYNKLQDSPEHP